LHLIYLVLFNLLKGVEHPVSQFEGTLTYSKQKNSNKAIFVLITLLVLMVGWAFFIQPAKAASLTILSHRGYHDSIGGYWIWGEFQNLEDKPIMCEYVTATFYDSGNNVIAVQNWSAGGSIVLPNQKMPFLVLFISSVQNATQIDHYTLSVPASYTTYTLLDVKVASYNTSVNTIGFMPFAGEVENTGNMTANNTRVFVTCYDSEGKVVWSSFTFTKDSEILSGQKSSFETVSVPREVVPQVKSSTLVAQAYIITSTPSIPNPHQETPPDSSSSANGGANIYTVWAPPPQNAVAATAVTVGAVGVVAVAVTAGTRSAGASAGKAVEKAHVLVPDSVKKWLEEFVASKRKPTVEHKTGSPFLPTKAEAVAYAVSLVALTISFSYVKVPNFSLILQVLPTVLATAVIVEFVKTYLLEVFARSRGVWIEHKLWYFGLALFLVTTFTFGVPFSSPSRNVYHSEKLTKRLNGIIGAVAIIVTLAFGALFFGLIISGFTLIGSTGLAMCIIMAFIDTFPMAPMSGKAVLDHNKAVWAGLFAATLLSYVAWLLIF
jgi:hypothetical protein